MIAVAQTVVSVDMAGWASIFGVVHCVGKVVVVVRVMDCSQQAEVGYAAVVDVEYTMVEVSCCRSEVGYVVVAVVAAAMEIAAAIAVLAGTVLLDGFGFECQSSIQRRPYCCSSFRYR